MRNYTHYTNQDLLTGLQLGDRMAFTEIYNRYWKKIYIIAYNRMNDGAQAEDIAQEVFASLWANRSCVHIETLENYLATAAKYLVLTAMRKKVLSRHYGETQKNISLSLRTPETSFQNKQILQLLELEIEKLPEKCRLIFKYSRNEGMAVKQIAAKMQISPKTVENQIYKALKILKIASRSFMQLICLLFI